VAEFVAAITLSDKGKRIKKFSFASGTKHKDRILCDMMKAGAILIKEGKDN